MSSSFDDTSLRRRAQARIRAGGQDAGEVDPDAGVEMRILQAALAIQQEDLQAVRDELECVRSRYRSLVEFSPCGYLMLSTAGLIRDLNRRAVELLRRDRGMLTDRPLRDCFTEPCRQQLDEMLAAALRGGSTAAADDLVLDRPLGLPAFVRVQARWIEPAGREPAALLVILTDVSALKQAVEDVVRTFARE